MALDLEQRKQQWQASVADCRKFRWETSASYKKVQWQMFFKRLTHKASVLHIGCGTGDLLAMLAPSRAVGIEPCAELAYKARISHPEIEIVESPLENFQIEGDFDYILVDDVLLDCFDIDELFQAIRGACHQETRILITTYSQLWRPLLKILRFFRLAKPRFGNTWFSPEDLRSALKRCGFEIISASSEVLFPLKIPLLSTLMNRFLAHLPFLRAFCLHHVFVARCAGKSVQKN